MSAKSQVSEECKSFTNFQFCYIVNFPEVNIASAHQPTHEKGKITAFTFNIFVDVG